MGPSLKIISNKSVKKQNSVIEGAKCAVASKYALADGKRGILLKKGISRDRV